MSIFNVVMVVLFIIGFILTVSERLKFEKEKNEYDAKYQSLFRRHNFTMLLLYLGLTIVFIERIIKTL